MIYLIGVEHKIQYDGSYAKSQQERDKFSIYLKQQVLKLKISLIAEELSEEALRKYKGNNSTAKLVAKELNVIHLFCDPNTNERKLAGIPPKEEIKNEIEKNIPKNYIHRYQLRDEKTNEEMKKYHTIREKFWVEKIKNYLNQGILFICGAEHVQSFEKLLLENKCKASILIMDWDNVI